MNHKFVLLLYLAVSISGCSTIGGVMLHDPYATDPINLQTMAIVQYQHGNPDLGNRLIDKASNVLEASSDSKDLSLHYMVKGYICWRYELSQGANCAQHYHLAEKYAIDSGVDVQVAIVLLEHAWYLQKSGDIEGSCKLMEKAAAIPFKPDDRTHIYVDDLPFGFNRTRVFEIQSLLSEFCPQTT